jgi:hypothetical protein
MKPKSLAICLLATLILALTPSLWASEKDSIKIIEVKAEAAVLPKEVDSGSVNKVLDESWHVIQVKFSTEDELIEEVQIKFFVEGEDSKKDKQFVVLTSEVTYLNVTKGEHMAYVYLTPGSAQRYAGEKGKDLKDFNIHVDILENGRMAAQKDKKEKDELNWYTSAQQVNSVLVSLIDSPFWPASARRVDQIKSRN